MAHSSEEDTDISESEIEEYGDQAFEDLKKGSRELKVFGEKYACPYCPGKRKRDYQYKELLQHASGVGKATSNKRRAREKANHLGLARFLEGEGKKEAGSSNQQGSDDNFVWPWTGIVVNIQTQFKDGKFVGESGTNLREELKDRGFNPNKVRPLWNSRGHSGIALVEFKNDWLGWTNALAFEKEYELSKHGKKHWLAKDTEKSGLYAWVARADDYNGNDITAKQLRTIGDLYTVAELEAQEARKNDKLVSSLKNVLERKKKCLQEMEIFYSEQSHAFFKITEEKDKQQRAAIVQQQVDENMMRLAEEHKKQNEDFDKRILQLKSQLEAKQALEYEIELLKGKLKVMDYVGDKADKEAMLRDLRDKEEKLVSLLSLNHDIKL